MESQQCGGTVFLPIVAPCNHPMHPKILLLPVADLGISGGGDGLGDEGEGAGGGTPSRRGSGGLATGKIFCK
jgi:hypothetical protein